MGLLVFGLLIVLILFGVPIGFALMIAGGLAMLLADIDLVTMSVQLFYGTNSFIVLAVPLFILMGELMGATSISERLIDLARALVGWLHGGLSHVNIVTSMFMAEMSGSAVADAAALGKIFIPQMERAGYPRSFAAAVTATSATIGAIIPPSIMMVIYGATTNTSIRDLFIGGIVPGILLGFGFMATSYVFALRDGHPIDERFEVRRLGVALRRAAVPLMIPVIVLGGMLSGIFTPTEASGIAVATALLFGFVMSRELTMVRLMRILQAAAKQSAVVMMLVAGSAVLGQYLANEQVPQTIAAALTQLSDNPVIALLLMNLLLLVLGMVLQAAAAIIVVVPMLIPLAMEMGIDPVHFGVIVCLNLGIGQQTPPVATVLLTVCSISDLQIEEVMHYAKWFILSMFVVLMVVSYIPTSVLWFRMF
jgi:tripartite ATP-independent transporter DctM subunit